MAFLELITLGKLDSELSEGKNLDELSRDVLDILGRKCVFEYVEKYICRFPNVSYDQLILFRDSSTWSEWDRKNDK